ncbi:zinc finger BED domain-containing protein 1-like [Rhizophagus irregularis DAOM 181602=DAOM 197198]|nr:zinc finger BED domain-containing protein 1-like [Rhizophagus irregularis DAOM 181602=DAOM 197198]
MILSHLAIKIKNKIDFILENAMNLTLGLDDWTNPAGHSIYNFIVITYDHQEFLYKLWNLSIIRYTAENLAEKIKTVLKKIGPGKFAAIVTDNAANCAAANIISEKYTFIFNTYCIAHCVNLITKDVIGTCNEVVKFFKKSHQGKALLEKYTKEFNIEGEGLKT